MKLYIIPGLGETIRSKNYREVVKYARNIGIKIISIKIDWQDGSTMSDFIKQVDKQIPKKNPEDYILGFSFGAYITAILSKNRKVKGYIFCSLSPYFKEDLKKIPKESEGYFGKVFMNDLKKYSSPKKSSDQAWFLIGDKDWDIAIDRTKLAFKQWRGEKELLIIKNAGHQLFHPSYISRLKKILKKL